MSQIIPLFKRVSQGTNPKSDIGGRLEKFFLFRLSEKTFTVLAVDVSEVGMYEKPEQGSETPDYISGFVTVRGTKVPIVDVRRRMGLEAFQKASDNTRIIYFSLTQGLIGMIVDDIEYRLKDGIIAAEPHNNEASSQGEKFKIVVIGESRYPVFLFDELLSAEDFETINKYTASL